jgi:uncharacterized lipoprotein YmbA
MKRWSAVLFVVLAGCASSPAPRWHSLVEAPAAAAAAASASPAAGGASLVIERITLPDEADRAPLVLQGSGGQRRVLDGERWAEPLDAQLGRSLALALARRAPSLVIAGAPSGVLTRPDWRLRLEVQRFELRPGDGALLRAVWVLRPGAGPAASAPAASTPAAPGTANATVAAAPSAQVFERSEAATGDDPALLVAAMARNVDALAQQVAGSLCVLTRC